ncbi:MAG: hypothetical protein OHK0038_24570 [Flammeovirgaceae bacterium]
MLRFSFLAIFVFVSILAKAQSSLYYWSDNRQIPLKENKNKIVVQISQGTKPDNLVQKLKNSPDFQQNEIFVENRGGGSTYH